MEANIFNYFQKVANTRLPPKIPTPIPINGLILFLATILFIATIFAQINISSIILDYAPDIYSTNPTKAKTPTYWIPDDSKNLQVVHKIFQTFGFMQNHKGKDWDIMWTNVYPFQIYKDHLVDLKPHQKLNHIPGTQAFSYKVNLSMTDVKFIPKSFRIPNDVKKLKDYAEKNPEHQFLLKGKMHRNIEMVKLHEIDLTSRNVFVQKFVDNPYLVNGRKFDIGK